MHKIHVLLVSAGILFLAACQNDGADGVQEIRGNGPNSSVIRNPISANMPLDTNQLARMVFEEDHYDFGEAKEGTMVEHVYKFKNTGKVPLIIANCRSTCGCTVPEWPKDEIEPGGTGEIKATFNTDLRSGHQRKGITITANTYPSEIRIYLEGEVIPKKK